MDDKTPERLDDGALTALLAEAGSRFDAAGLRALLAGVLAAPAGEDPEAWMTMVAHELSEPLRERLRALKSEAEAAAGAGETPDHAARLAALRAELARRGLDGFLVPRADRHQSEYVPPYAERLAWLTGFTGSAGLAVVLNEQAALFVDGRYTLQAETQVDGEAYALRHLIEQPPAKWIEESLPEGAKLGYDPWLHTRDGAERLAKAAERAGGSLVPVEGNPLDAVWPDQPPPPLAPVVAHETAFAGRPMAEKLEEVCKALGDKGAAACVLTRPDSIAWLLNVRGADVPHTPLPQSFALVHAEGDVEWFVDERKPVPGLGQALGNRVAIAAPEALGDALDALGRDGAKVLVDPASAADWLLTRLEQAGAALVKEADPCQLPKARKNAVELEGSRAAHRRDGAALTRFLAWLDREAPARAGNGARSVTEQEAAERLAGYRREEAHFRDLSFDTISGAGENGAIIHYRVTEESDRPLGLGELYLVDSGGQYLDGTTDVTRTVAIGEPTAEMRERFTRVLKGHIALATARFPKGTSGSQLDSLARLPLWQAGLDFDHGTGHGVGSYLGVHEGPQSVSKVPNRVPLEPGMIVSNEPGYYRNGGYGIRIENLVAVVESPPPEGREEDKPMLGFETLTLAPIDRRLIEPALLSAPEIAWLDAYHARVRETLAPRLDAEAAAWLERATAPLAPADSGGTA